MAAITIDGVRREVAIARNDDGFAVVVDGRRYQVREVARVDGGVAFLIGNDAHVVRVADGRERLELAIDGRVFVQQREVVDADRPRGPVRRDGDARLEAPMPGAIVAVHVAQGDRVRTGQPLVVLESMKMHNEIASPVDGVVRRVNCRAGEQVGYGQVLVEIGSEAS